MAPRLLGTKAMTYASIRTRIVSVLGLGMVFAATYFGVIRPWHRVWGATEEEQTRVLPGDELVPHARRADGTTHAITISAPPARVWPWLAQLGQDRGGFYSFEVLEDMVGCEMTNSARILEAKQAWTVGDKLWMYPPSKAGGAGHAVLKRLIPGRALCFATHQIGSSPERPYDGTWSFVLEPRDPHATRLLIRGLAEGEPSWGVQAFNLFVFEPLHFIMERRMMENLKALSEGHQVLWVVDSLQVLLWFVCVALGVVSLALTFRRGAWGRAWLALAASGTALQVLVLLQPSLSTGFLLVIALAWLTWSAWRHRQPAEAYLAHVPPPMISRDVLR